MSMTDSMDFDVVIVGYGPTGLASSSLLARLGHRVAVFERWPSLYGLPRLVNLDAEAVRIVQASGDLKVALDESTQFTRYLFKNAAGQTLLEMDWSGTAVSGFPKHLSMYQPHVEDAIDAAARERGVSVNQGWEVTDLVQGDEDVTLTVRSREHDSEKTVRAKWVIGADGAKSTIRELLGIEREDLGMRSAFLNLDTLRRRPLVGTDSDRFDTPTVVTAPPRMHVVVPIGERRLRFELEVLESDQEDELLKPETAWRFLRDSHDLGPEDVEIYRQVVYEFDSQLALSWRDRRVLLAGDAAHQMSPFIGQGACSGLRDAINLSWRLDLILRGVCGDTLLDSYEIERSPHVRAQILISAGLGQMATLTDFEASRGRDQAFLSGNAPPPPPDPLLGHGVLSRDSDGALALLAGELGPQGRVSHNGRVGRADDVLGWGFALVCDGMDPLADLSDAHRALLDALGGRTVVISQDPATSLVRDLDGSYAQFFAEHSVAALLVRPDFYIFGAARNASEVAALLDDLGNQLGATLPVA